MRYTANAMTPIGPHKPLIGLGVALLCAAVLAGVWETLALQSPGTSLYIGMLPGPIAALRELCTTLGLSVALAALGLGWSGRVAPRLLLCLLYVGSLAAVGAQLFGATRGMPGVQIVDFRPGVRPLFVTKYLGLLAAILALFEVGRRVLFAAGGPRPRLPAGGGSSPAQLDSEERRH
jgi:hypothetical protein